MRSFVNLKSNKSHFDLIFNFRCPGWGEEHYTSNFLQRLYLHIFFVKWLLICSILFCFELDFSPFTEYVTSNSCLVIISIHSTRNSFCSINILFFPILWIPHLLVKTKLCRSLSEVAIEIHQEKSEKNVKA